MLLFHRQQEGVSMADAGDVVEDLASNTKDAFIKKVGPLPLWGYAAIGLVGLYFFTRLKRSKGMQSVKPSGVESPISPSFMGGTVSLPNGFVASTDETNADERVIWTNNDWVFQAARKLAPNHPEDSTDVLRRLRQYLSGAAIADAEYSATIAIAEEAISLVGPPPEPFVPVSSSPSVPSIPSQDKQIPALIGPVNNGRDVIFTLQDFSGSIERAAEHFFGDASAWGNFRIYDPAGVPTTGWINSKSYHELQPHTKLVAGPRGRIRD
jgi:hypothetical protein